jgi:hypothetical protein
MDVFSSHAGRADATAGMGHNDNPVADLQARRLCRIDDDTYGLMA